MVGHNYQLFSVEQAASLHVNPMPTSLANASAATYSAEKGVIYNEARSAGKKILIRLLLRKVSTLRIEERPRH